MLGTNLSLRSQHEKPFPAVVRPLVVSVPLSGNSASGNSATRRIPVACQWG